MPQFIYKAIQSDGSVSEGILEAPSRVEAATQLERRGLQPVRVEPKEEAPSKGKSQGLVFPFRLERVPFAQLEDFTRSLASLLAAGVPLSRALAILAQETPHPVARKRWQELHDLVIDGVSLADAMAQYPDVFPQVYVAMVEAGETGGFLELVLNQIADFQSRQRELRSRILAALIYPSVLLTLAIGVLIFLLSFFIPRFQLMFEGFHASLPKITQLVVGLSHLVRSYGLYLFFLLIGGVTLFIRWLRTESGRRRWEEFLLKLPLLGRLAALMALARFCRMLGTLLQAGVPMIQALNVARRSIGYQILSDAVVDSVERVRRGEPLAESLKDCPLLFSGSTLEMIRVAEESGRLEQELIRLADVNEQALDRGLKMAVSLAEPLILFFIAAFIGTIFVSMVLPIFTLQDYIR